MSAIHDLAEDYVLGLLDARDAAGVEARIASPVSAEDRMLASAVGHARDMLLPLDLTAPALPLRPDAWDRLEAKLGRQDPAETMPGNLPIGSGQEDQDRVGGRRLRGWRLTAITASAAALLLAALLSWQTLLVPRPAVLVVLVNDGGEAVAVLEAYDDNRVVVTPLRGVEAGPSQVLQLWTKPDPDGPPVSVGLLQRVARMAVRNPDLPEPADGQLYEITLEPEGGSPTGQPTGPVVGIGNAQIPVLGGS